MANRPFFIATKDSKRIYLEKNCEFTFYTGFALSQKQKTIKSFHNEIQKYYPKAKILEVSRRSEHSIGMQLSAFNLLFEDPTTKEKRPVENFFQSSKVFEGGGPFKDLLNCTPKEAKQDIRLKNSGKLIGFNFDNDCWEITPQTMFYDFLYISALLQNKKLIEEVLKYDIFTDIEFNPKKSLNCQARSVAIFVSLTHLGIINKYMNDKQLFKTIYLESMKCVQNELF